KKEDKMVAKRLGRPPKPKEDRKSVNFAFRGRGQLRERLREAAATSGRSISEEIEQRLEQSLRQDGAYDLFRALSRETVESIHRDLRTQLAIKIAAEIFRRNPQAQISGLLSLAKYLPEAQATRAKDVLEMTDDEAEFVAEAEAPEQTRADAANEQILSDIKESLRSIFRKRAAAGPPEDTSKQPKTDKGRKA